jgi:hypothetical protein
MGELREPELLERPDTLPAGGRVTFGPEVDGQ